MPKKPTYATLEKRAISDRKKIDELLEANEHHKARITEYADKLNGQEAFVAVIQAETKVLRRCIDTVRDARDKFRIERDELLEANLRDARDTFRHERDEARQHRDNLVEPTRKLVGMENALRIVVQEIMGNRDG